jgi:hypothetical protein
MTYITLMPSLVLLHAQNLPIDCVQIKYQKRDLGIQDKKQKLLKNILHSRATLHKRTVLAYQNLPQWLNFTGRDKINSKICACTLLCWGESVRSVVMWHTIRYEPHLLVILRLFLAFKMQNLQIVTV